MAATISTPHYLLDQARRRFTPSINNFPGMGLVERRLLNTHSRSASWPTRRRAAGSRRPWVTRGCRSSGTSSRCCAAARTI